MLDCGDSCRLSLCPCNCNQLNVFYQRAAEKEGKVIGNAPCEGKLRQALRNCRILYHNIGPFDVVAGIRLAEVALNAQALKLIRHQGKGGTGGAVRHAYTIFAAFCKIKCRGEASAVCS